MLDWLGCRFASFPDFVLFAVHPIFHSFEKGERVDISCLLYIFPSGCFNAIRPIITSGYLKAFVLMYVCKGYKLPELDEIFVLWNGCNYF